MATISATVSQWLQVVLNSTLPSGDQIEIGLPNLSRRYATGTGANEIDDGYSAVLNLVGSATTLDLTTLTDLNGNAITCQRVREFAVQNLGTKPITISGGASNPWAQISGIVVPPGGIHQLSDPTSTGTGIGAVVTSTSKTVKFDPGANTVQANLVIGTCSATS